MLLVAQHPGGATENELGRGVQCAGGNDAARRIIRRVDDHQLRALTESIAQLVEREAEVRARHGGSAARARRPPTGSPTRSSGSRGLGR